MSRLTEKNKKGLQKIKELAEKAGPLPCSMFAVGEAPKKMKKFTIVEQAEALLEMGASMIDANTVEGLLLELAQSNYNLKLEKLANEVHMAGMDDFQERWLAVGEDLKETLAGWEREAKGYENHKDLDTRNEVAACTIRERISAINKVIVKNSL